MTSRTGMIVLAGWMVGMTGAYGQSLIDPRGVALGVSPALVNDSRGFGLNPAGVVLMRDWDFSVATYTSTSTPEYGFVFQGLTLGKRFLEREAVAFEYAPGTQLRLVIPPTLSISGFNVPVTNERIIEYSEPGGAAFAHRVSPELSLGIGMRYREETITDQTITLLPRDSIPLFPVTTNVEHRGRTWAFDLGILWMPQDNLTVGATVKRLFRYRTTEFPDSLHRYRLPDRVGITAGLLVQPFESYALTATATTEGFLAAGQEWKPGLGFALRASLYADKNEKRAIDAVGIGLGWTLEMLEFGASYLWHTDRQNHKGSVSLERFDPGLIHLLDHNPFTPDRFTVSVRAMFGSIRDQLARIEQVQMYGDVYPSSFEVFAYRPIGKARVRNLSENPVQARVSFFVDRFMDGPTESQSITIPPGDAAEVELTAVFNERVKSVEKMIIRDAVVSVTATPAERYDDRAQTRLLIRGKNDWDGDAHSLRYFVTPDDPEVLRTSRDLLLQKVDLVSGAPGHLAPFVKARTLIDGFAGRLMYVGDPKLTTDYVQYPSETLKLRGGDCDDMTVCFAALLGSVGIATAFVDVVPPENPGKSHIYLLFDTGLDPKYGQSISENPKRYVVRRGQGGIESIWIPIETTVIARGFDASWTAGAQAYFDDVELRLGLVKNWVRIVDVN